MKGSLNYAYIQVNGQAAVLDKFLADKTKCSKTKSNK
jgi:hypothetical protein